MTGQPGKPLLFVDVDGVLNLWQPPFPPDSVEYDWFPDEEPVRLRPVHATWLRELGAVVDLVWATAWAAQDRDRIATALDLPRFTGSIDLPPPPFPPQRKVPAVASYAGKRPLAWLDDQLTDEAFRWAAKRSSPAFLVAVDSSTGLTRAHVDAVTAWARSLES